MAQVKKSNISSNKNVRSVKKVYTSPFSIYWLKDNYLFLALGIAVIAAGFFVMSLGKWDDPVTLYAAPILLAIGYFVILPLSIFFKRRSSGTSDEK